MAIVIEYLLGRLDYMNTLSETVDKYNNANNLSTTTPINPFIQTTTANSLNTPIPGTIDDDEECSGNWVCSCKDDSSI